VQGEIDRAQGATTSPRAAGEYAGSFIDPMRIAAALRKTAPVLELDVYHGTPHRFPATEANPLGEFDASKIGTGEGAQAYGHGVYLAENPSVASGYRKDLSNYTQPFIQFKEQKIAGSNLSDLDMAAYKYLETGQKNARQFPHNTVYYAKKAVENASDDYWSEGFTKAEILKRIDEFGSDVKFGQEKNTGSLYKADLPDEMIDRMLDYDKPINEQSQVVLDALERAGINTQSTALAGPMAQGQEGHLAKYGIPGIKYADAGSRGQGGSGTRNFVVFPGEEKKVRILERK
jgi:hypothetical protein